MKPKELIVSSWTSRLMSFILAGLLLAFSLPAMAISVSFTGQINTDTNNVNFTVSFMGFSENAVTGQGNQCGTGTTFGYTTDLTPLARGGTASIQLYGGHNACCLGFALQAPICYDVYANGIRCGNPGLGTYGNGFCGLVAGNVGRPAYSAVFTLVPNQNSEAIAEWGATNNSLNGHYTLPADGMSQAIGTVLNNAGPVTFEIVGDSHGCTLINSPGHATLTVSTNSGTVQVFAETTNQDDCLVTNFFFDIGDCPCSSCESGFCPLNAKNHSVDIRLSLGPSALGHDAFLQVNSENPSATLGTPASLQCNFLRPDLEVATNSLGWLRQVRSQDRIIDITTNSSYSYSLAYYRPDDVAGIDSNGFCLFGNNPPFETATISLVNGNTNHVQYVDSLSPTPADYYWQGSGWSLVTGNGLKNDTLLTTNNGGPTYTKYRFLQNPAGHIDYQYTETWQTNTFGDRLIQKVTGSGADAQTETYTYTAAGKIQQENHRDGSWDIYTYDSMNRVTGHYSPFLNSTPTTNMSQCRFTSYTFDDSVVPGSGDIGTMSLETPRQTVTYVLGQEVARSYTIVKSGELDQISCVNTGAAWNATGNLVTTTLTHTDFEFYGQPSEIVNPDGTVETFSYLNGATGPETVASTGAPGLGDGTTVTTFNDQFGHTILREQNDIASGILTSAETNSYDANGHLTNTAYLDGTSVQQLYDCCNPVSKINRDGTITSYGYDELNRLQLTWQNGIAISNVYNANGRLTGVFRYGVDGSMMTNNISAYDDAGQLISSADGLGNITYYTNYLTSSGYVKITTYPNSTTRIETNNFDGSLQSVTDTAVLGVRYVYGVEVPTGETVARLYTKEIKLNADGSDSSEWTKTYTDMMGRAYKTVYADGSISQSVYNNQGQLAQQTDPDGVTTLYQYNAKGQLAYTATDMNTNGVIDFGGADRISETISDVVADNGANVNRTRTFVWNITNSVTSNLVSQAETSVNGLETWNVTFNNGVGATNFSTTSYVPAQGTRLVTSFAPDGSYRATIYQFGRLISVTQYDANSVQIGATTYGYDAHGRQTTATDARNGTTTSYYNGDGQAVATLTPSPDGVQTGLLTTNVLDSLGRVIQSVQPDGTAVTNVYYSDGLLEETYGTRTYPVEYTYDYAGRMKTMTTWTNFAISGGAAVTTWNYDAFRGFMTNKAYADGKGPFYTYTAGGRLKTRLWARGVATTNFYDSAGALLKVNYSDSTPGITNSYDRLGRLLTVVSGGITNTMAYNGANQLLSESYSGGPLSGLGVTNYYDQDNRRTNFTVLKSPNSVLASSIYGYDAASRLSTVSDGTNNAAYTYLANSMLAGQMTFKSNSVVRMTTTRQYDYLNRLTQISSAPAAGAGVSFNYAYNSANQRTTVTNVDGSYWVYQYDNLGQVTSGKKYWADGTPVAGQQFTYIFDTIGNRKSTASGGDSSGNNLRNANYTNNVLNELAGRDVPGYVNILGSANPNSTVTVDLQRAYRYGSYFWDELYLTNTSTNVFQIITNLAVLNNGTNKDIITTNTGNILLAQTPQAFKYDPDGNLTNDGVFSYQWDAENRLTNVTSLAGVPTNAAVQETWNYLPDGRWSQAIVSTWQVPKHGSAGYVPVSTNLFVWDGQVLAAEVAPGNAVIRSYMRGSDLSGTIQGAGGVGGLLAMSYYGAVTTNCFVAYDGNGNVAALVNAADGTTVANYEYDPFGQTIRRTGPMASANPIRFSTQWADDNLKDIKYLYRVYSPAIGKWLSRDPIEEAGGINLHDFVDNNPINRVDRKGMFDGWDDLVTCAASLASSWMGKYVDEADAASSLNSRVTADDIEGAGDKLCKGYNYPIDVSSYYQPTSFAQDISDCIFSKIKGDTIEETLRAITDPNKRKAVAIIVGSATDQESPKATVIATGYAYCVDKQVHIVVNYTIAVSEGATSIQVTGSGGQLGPFGLPGILRLQLDRYCCCCDTKK